MKNKKEILLASLTGALLGLSWNGAFPAWTLFFAFIPFLVLMENDQLPYITIFTYSFYSFLLYHVGTVWWLSKSSVFGFLVIITSNSMYLALAMTLIYRIKRIFGQNALGFVFVSIWLSFEYVHYSWELSWPFMNLGNWLGQVPKFIQWYEYTGVLGGSFWILILNLFLYSVIRKARQKQFFGLLLSLSISIMLFVFPILFSLHIYNQPGDIKEYKNFTIIQPNIDPYTEKYKTELYGNQIVDQIDLAKTEDSIKTDCFLFPESSFPAFFIKKSS